MVTEVCVPVSVAVSVEETAVSADQSGITEVTSELGGQIHTEPFESIINLALVCFICRNGKMLVVLGHFWSLFWVINNDPIPWIVDPVCFASVYYRSNLDSVESIINLVGLGHVLKNGEKWLDPMCATSDFCA